MKISKKLLILYIMIFALILGGDLFTKNYVETHMNLYDSISIIPGFFSFTYIQNRGAAWGILQGRIGFLIVISIVAGAAIIYYFLHSKEEEPLLRLGLVMVFAGMLGNLYDRLLIGYVRDFIDFIIFGYDFPVFNVADMGVTIGMAFVILQLIIEEYQLWKYKKSQQE